MAIMFFEKWMAISFFFSSMIFSIENAKTSLKYFLLIFGQILAQNVMKMRRSYIDLLLANSSFKKWWSCYLV